MKKLKTLKPHYYEGIYRNVGHIYTADIVHIALVVKRGICEEIKNTRKTPKKETKKQPRSKKDEGK